MKTKLLVLLFLASLSTYAQTNLVPNGGFETWTNSTTLSNWTIANNVTQNTSNFIEGIKSAQLSVTNNTLKPEIIAQVPMTAGTTYTVKFKYKYVSANFNGQHPISLNISQNGSATTLSSSTFATNNNWNVKETTFTPDQNLSYDLSISLYTFDAAAFNVLIDDVQFYIQGTEQYTLIPDVNFEKKLIALGIDSGATDGKVLTNSVNKLTTLDVSYSSIADLTGIQDFVALTTLNCNTNQLTTLDVSKNVALTYLVCYENQITGLDVSKNLSLQELNCISNKLTTLDVSKNVALTALYCSRNKLTMLDISKNLALTYFGCYENQITGLDVSKNVALTALYCDSNKLTTLDVSKNVALTALYCDYNQLTTLDVSKNVDLRSLLCQSTQITSLDVSKNVALGTLYCSGNKLTVLDISKNLALTALSCFGNQITSLDLSKNVALDDLNCTSNNLLSLNLKNGKNTLIRNSRISLYGNPKLYCILVDDVAYSNTNWATYKDTWATFNTECNFSLPTNNFTVESKGETCLNSNNGEINITATATFGYKAIINAGSYTFTNNSLKVPNLVPGTYTVTITIPGETFEQSFSITIPKGATITGKSSVAANKVSVEITEGTAPYTVFVDGVEQFETTDTNFTVETKKGGLLQVKTAKACEGIYAKDIARLDGVISAYPNPTSGSFEIELPSTKKEVVITLYTLDGQMVSTKTYTVENGKAQLTLENQPAGVYVAKIELDTPDYLKIIKN